MPREGGQTPRQLRIKAGTAIVTTAVALALVFYDWGAQGQENCFSSIRPATLRALSALYDSGPAARSSGLVPSRPPSSPTGNSDCAGMNPDPT